MFFNLRYRRQAEAIFDIGMDAYQLNAEFACNSAIIAVVGLKHYYFSAEVGGYLEEKV